MTRRRRRTVVLLALLLGPGLLAAPAASAAAEEQDVGVAVPDAVATDGTVRNAQLRWSVNAESGAGAYFGGCNFLSAGTAGDAGSARLWTRADGFHRGADGAVRIEAPDGAGGVRVPDFDTKCLDAAGQAVQASSTTSTSGNEVVIDGGTGTIGSAGTEVRWTGSFTVAFYGGLTYWSAADPVLRLDAAGDGALTAVLSGYGTSMEDTGRWERLEGRTVTLATVRGAEVGPGGLRTTPAYLGVPAPGADQVPQTADNAAYWGAFPADFIAFQRLTGQAGYWYTSGGARDAAKPAAPLTVNADADAPAFAPPAAAPRDESAAPRNTAVFRDRAAPLAPAQPADALTAPPAQPSAEFARGSALSLVPEAIRAGPPLAIGALALCALVSALSVLSMTGRLRMPWSPSRP